MQQLALLYDLFGTRQIDIVGNEIQVAGVGRFPIVDGVIVLLPPEKWTPHVHRAATQGATAQSTSTERVENYSRDVQDGFGAEWTAFSEMEPEYRSEFDLYFDIVDLEALRGKRVVDFGAGMGRWSFFLADYADSLIVIDFSDAIFEARRNLAQADNAIFFMGDLTDLPLRNDFADFAICLGVLHHLPSPALIEARRLARYAPEILIYLYSALDGQPLYYRILFRIIHLVRIGLLRIRSPIIRRHMSNVLAVILYAPGVAFFSLVSKLGLINEPPFLRFYRGKSIRRLSQDAYDRFFTSVEQRVTQKQVKEMSDVFEEIVVSDGLPRWHFLCRRRHNRNTADMQAR